MIFVHHCGTCHFKGVSELQTVMSLSIGNLAHRTFPPGYTSNKATLESPFRGLQAIIALQAPSDRSSWVSNGGNNS